MKRPFAEHQIRAIYSGADRPQLQQPAGAAPGRLVRMPGQRACAPHATAVPQRSSIMKLQYQTYWAYAEDDQVNLRWINDFYANVYAAHRRRPGLQPRHRRLLHQLLR